MRTKGTLNILTAGWVAIGLLASCSGNDDIDERELNLPVRFTAGIEQAMPNTPQSRAAGTGWATIDKIGIFMVQSGTELSSNKEYKVTDTSSGAFEAAQGDDIFYPQAGTVDFIAYYPYTPHATLGTAIPVEIGTAQTSANQPAFDLLYSNNAKDKVRSDDAVNLTFAHTLTKLVMNVTAGAGLYDSDLTGMTVTIKGMNTRNTFDLSDGTLGAAETPAAIAPHTVTDGAQYDAIILPSVATQTEGEYSVDFTLRPGSPEAETFTWKMETGTNFKGGNEYIYTVTLSRTSITTTSTIKPWTSIDRGAVTAE